MSNIHNDDKYHYCASCGRKWARGHKYPWWPISFDFKFFFRKRPKGWSKSFLDRSYWQVGYADIGVHVYRRIIRIGRLIIRTGPRKAELPVEYVPEKDMWLQKDQAERLKKSIQRDKDLAKIMEEYGNKLE